jgi:hypothetical protein
VLLGAWWSCCVFASVLFYWRDDRFVLPITSGAFPAPVATVGRNETGPFAIGRADPSAGYKPAFRIAWRNLRAENGRLGVFRTPVYKTVIVDDLDIRLYSYFYPVYAAAAPAEGPISEAQDDARVLRFESPLFASPSNPHSGAAAKMTRSLARSARPAHAVTRPVGANENLPGIVSRARDVAPVRSPSSPSERRAAGNTPRPATGHMSALRGTAEELRRRLRGLGGLSPALIDVSNATKVIVRNLNYRVLNEGEVELAVQCADATVSNPASEVLLRGCVVITTGDGNRLMSNSVRWDLETNEFTVPDTFVLQRDATLTRGRGLRCDSRLEPRHAKKEAAVEPRPVYRFCSRAQGRHFFTLQAREIRKLAEQHADSWKGEGLAWYAFGPEQQPPGTAPVYRLRQVSCNTYFLTLDESERDRLLADGSGLWSWEGVAFYAYPPDRHPAAAKPVYRFWSNQTKSHLYTASEDERDALVKTCPEVWAYEGIAWYAPAGRSQPGGWAQGQDRPNQPVDPGSTISDTPRRVSEKTSQMRAGSRGAGQPGEKSKVSLRWRAK